ncbi:MAG: glycerol-3-phosphate acyltransferase [Patescibacteria group bacterium]
MIWVLVGAAAYLVGSFPSAVVVGRLWRGVDIRGMGSGNPGAANALRTLGPVPGAVVLLLDLGKGLAGSLVPAAVFGFDHGLPWLGGLMAVVGHVFPVFAGFRGGKGLATGCGAILPLMPWGLAVFAPVWGLVYLLKRKIAPASAAGILAVALASAAAYALGRLAPWPLTVVFLGLFLIFMRHWPEARREILYRKK